MSSLDLGPGPLAVAPAASASALGSTVGSPPSQRPSAPSRRISTTPAAAMSKSLPLRTAAPNTAGRRQSAPIGLPSSPTSARRQSIATSALGFGAPTTAGQTSANARLRAASVSSPAPIPSAARPRAMSAANNTSSSVTGRRRSSVVTTQNGSIKYSTQSSAPTSSATAQSPTKTSSAGSRPAPRTRQMAGPSSAARRPSSMGLKKPVLPTPSSTKPRNAMPVQSPTTLLPRTASAKSVVAAPKVPAQARVPRPQPTAAAATEEGLDKLAAFSKAASDLWNDESIQTHVTAARGWAGNLISGHGASFGDGIASATKGWGDVVMKSAGVERPTMAA